MIAVSKSGKPFYVTNAISAREYTGVQSGSGWIAAAATSCQDAIGTNHLGIVGYNYGSSTWASWTNAN